MLRQIRWEVETDHSTRSNNYKFWIINDKREIDLILQKLFEQLAPAEEPITITDGKVEGGDLRYRLVSILSFRTSPDQIEWGRVYKGRRVRDRRLIERETIDGLAKYIDEKMALGRVS